MKELLKFLPQILQALPEVVKYLKYIPILLLIGGISYGAYMFFLNMKDPYKCYNNQLFEQKSIFSNVYIFNGETCVDATPQKE